MEGTTASATDYLAVLLVALLSLHLAIRERPTAHADSAEYLLTAESLFNHGTPNVHPADLLSFGRIAVRHPLEGDFGRPLSFRALELLVDPNLGLLPYVALTLALALVLALVRLARRRTVYRSAAGCRKAWVQKRHLPAMAESCGGPPRDGPDLRQLKARRGPDAWAYVSWQRWAS
jgi:hypothetical protein